MKLVVKLTKAQSRKELAKIIAESAFDTTTKYSGTGSINGYRFAYQAGPLTLTKENELVGFSSLPESDKNLVTEILEANGYDCEITPEQGDWGYGVTELPDGSVAPTEETPDEPNVAPTPAAEAPEGANVPEAKEEALVDRIIQQLDGSALTVHCADQLEIGLPNDFTEAEIANLQDLMVQKMEILDQAFPGKIVMNVTPDRIEFPWFPAGEDATPYIMFITRFVEMARTAKRVSKKAQKITNPKYQFRCFLLRLGFIGKEYGPARKVLLSRLEGNSAWLRGSREA